jgi:hypothetical protein
MGLATAPFATAPGVPSGAGRDVTDPCPRCHGAVTAAL